MKIKALTAYLETIAPLAFQESYDNAGLLLGDPEATISNVLICLDSTEAVVQEAIDKDCNLIVAHHPIIFRGLKSLTGKNYVERTVLKAIRAGVAIYAIHTNLDNVFHRGVNARFAERLGLKNLKILTPKNDPLNPLPQIPVRNKKDTPHGTEKDPYPTVGSGMIGEFEKAISEEEFLDLLRVRMRADCVRYTALRERPVRKVALCGGTGSFLLKFAMAANADAYVTADVKYHEFFDADGKILLADIGHFESEQFTIETLRDSISEKFSNFAAYCTDVNTNPIHYRV